MGDADQLFEFLDRDDSGSLSIVESLAMDFTPWQGDVVVVGTCWNCRWLFLCKLQLLSLRFIQGCLRLRGPAKALDLAANHLWSKESSQQKKSTDWFFPYENIAMKKHLPWKKSWIFQEQSVDVRGSYLAWPIQDSKGTPAMSATGLSSLQRQLDELGDMMRTPRSLLIHTPRRYCPWPLLRAGLVVPFSPRLSFVECKAYSIYSTLMNRWQVVMFGSSLNLQEIRQSRVTSAHDRGGHTSGCPAAAISSPAAMAWNLPDRKPHWVQTNCLKRGGARRLTRRLTRRFMLDILHSPKGWAGEVGPWSMDRHVPINCLDRSHLWSLHRSRRPRPSVFSFGRCLCDSSILQRSS